MVSLERVGENKILCFGEIGWDLLWRVSELPSETSESHLISESAAPGGCTLNTACVLRALGVPVTLAGSAVGDDSEGRGVIEYLAKHGVAHTLRPRAGHRTQRCFCLVSAVDGDRTFVLAPGDVQWFGEELVAGLIPRVQAGEFTHLFVQPYIRQGAMRLLEQIQSTPAWILIQDVEADDPATALADCVQVSLPAAIPLEPEPLVERARAYLHGRCRQVWLTAGARGVGVVSLDARGEPLARTFAGLRAPGPVVDTTGCGDAFRAGAMAGLAQRRTLDEAIRLGQKVGAYQATVWGSHFTEGFVE